MLVKNYAKQRHELSMFCGLGLGLEAIARDVCRLVRTIVGGQACSIFFLSRMGQVESFFHEESPTDVKDLFANSYQKLFVGEHELNVTHVAQIKGRPCTGLFLAPPKTYFSSNTFNLLVKASGHHHALDLRIDHADGAQTVIFLFRPELSPFTEAERTIIESLLPYLKRANADAPLILMRPVVPFLAAKPSEGEYLLTEDGKTILSHSPQLWSLLSECGLVENSVSNQPPFSVPLLVAQFYQKLHGSMNVNGTGQIERLTPAGRLLIQAKVMDLVASSRKMTLFNLQLQKATLLLLLRAVLALHLSPLQKEIVFFAVKGGERGACGATLGISDEAMKKHINQIYAQLDVRDWVGLRDAVLRSVTYDGL